RDSLCFTHNPGILNTSIPHKMNLEQKIMADMKDAMKSKNEAALRSLRAVKAAIIIAKTAEGAGGELKEEDETKLLQKLVKQRRDSLDIFQKQNREDLAQKEQEEIAVIEKFLPKQMSEEELKAGLSEIIAQVGATSPADMGKVMGAATKQFAGKANGKAISTAVKELLSK
ncbi:MAG TPA: GatB/YqeY domain-containing protein, partial [Segetibacter sp.]